MPVNEAGTRIEPPPSVPAASGPIPPAICALAPPLDLSAQERGLRELEDELADPDAWASPTSAARASERHEAAKRELEELYAAWEEASQGAEPASTASE